MIDPEAIRNGNRRALSRALTAVENNRSEGQAILKALFPHTGKAHLVGITGAPGTGKSTLVNQLAKGFRAQMHHPRVAIIAVDPTSPFSGGALLGDRIRMRDLAGDQGIFIRSMASRGALGGLAQTTAALASLLDSAGYEIILIETVGAGQAEVDIAKLAHTVVVVEAPGLGDDIQAIKAGILEIADILVVNKSDKPGAENTARALKAMLDMAGRGGSLPLASKHLRQSQNKPQDSLEADTVWPPPVRLTAAADGTGVEIILKDIQAHRQHLESSGVWKVKERYRLRRELEALVRDMLFEKWKNQLIQGQFDQTLESVYNRSLSPIEAAENLIGYE
jgi:LAO/AO transport system kinase